LTCAAGVQLWGAIFAKRTLRETSGKSLKTISESYGRGCTDEDNEMVV